MSDGKEMARRRYPSRHLRTWVYGITDNPYKLGTKNHVKWHNDFYDECKKIGRHYR